MTVFFTLSLTVFVSVMFAFLEVGRYAAVCGTCRMETYQAGDALLSSYNRELMEKYGLMFYENSSYPDWSSAETVQKEAVNKNCVHGLLGREYYVLDNELKEIKVEQFALATDNNASDFRIQAARAEKLYLTEAAVEKLTGYAQEVGDEEQGEIDVNTALDTWKDIKTPKKDETGAEENADSTPAETEPVQPAEYKDNPLEWMETINKKGPLSLIVTEEEISTKSVDKRESASKRELNTGNMTDLESPSLVENTLFRLYLGSFFNDVTESPHEDSKLDYELEYVIAGKDDDKSNLRNVVNRLLLMREGANMLYLETDPASQEEAYAIALAICSAFGKPELAPLAKHAVMAAWAYAESISDLRILVAGGKVQPVKTAEQWHTDLADIAATFSGNAFKNQKEGLSYSDYLMLLMWSMDLDKVSARAIDVIEWNSGVKMDQMVSRISCSYKYEAEPLFWKFVWIGEDHDGNFDFEDNGKISFMSGD